MKIKAYDAYNKQEIIISFIDDEVSSCQSSSHRGCVHNVHMLVEAVKGDKDSCDLKRFSDLTNFELIK